VLKNVSKINVAVVMAWYVPYRVPLFRELAKIGGIDLTVIFCAPVEPGRTWPVANQFPFKTVFLPSRSIVRYQYRNLYGEKNTISYPFGLFGALRQANPDVVVGYEFRLECILAVMFSLLRRCGYVVWSDTTARFDARMGPIRKVVRRLILSFSNSLIGSSSDTIDHFCSSFSYPSERTFLSILSAHAGELAGAYRHERPKRDTPDDRVRFVYAGRLIALKGLDLLIKAFAAVRGRIPGVGLTIVGDGPELSSLRDLAVKLGCEHSVVFKGAMTHDELLNELVLHDIFVFPTLLDVFGLVVAEAMACGLPVVCSRWAGAARDLIQDNGIIVDPTNIFDLSEAMVKLVVNGEIRERMARAGLAILLAQDLQSGVEGFISAVKKAHCLSPRGQKLVDSEISHRVSHISHH
jgi:glycosyltransferase involved in cell wall biosynthesis